MLPRMSFPFAWFPMVTAASSTFAQAGGFRPLPYDRSETNDSRRPREVVWINSSPLAHVAPRQ